MNDLPWWAKPAGSTADVLLELHNTPVESGSVFPLTTYADNTTRFNPQAGVLGSLINAFTAPSRAYNGQIPPNQMVPEGMNMAGAIALSSLPLRRPSGTLGMGGRFKQTAARPEPGSGTPETAPRRISYGDYTSNNPHDQARQLAHALSKEMPEGFVSADKPVTYSTGSAGKSAYIHTRVGDIRVSDHTANPDYRVGEFDTSTLPRNVDSVVDALKNAIKAGRNRDLQKIKDYENELKKERPKGSNPNSWRYFQNGIRRELERLRKKLGAEE